jgi:hypothetical protein
LQNSRLASRGLHRAKSLLYDLIIQLNILENNSKFSQCVGRIRLFVITKQRAKKLNNLVQRLLIAARVTSILELCYFLSQFIFIGKIEPLWISDTQILQHPTRTDLVRLVGLTTVKQFFNVFSKFGCVASPIHISSLTSLAQPSWKTEMSNPRRDLFLSRAGTVRHMHSSWVLQSECSRTLHSCGVVQCIAHHISTWWIGYRGG